MRPSRNTLGLILLCLGTTVGCDTGSKTVVHTAPPAPTVRTVIVQAPSVPAALGNRSTPGVDPVISSTPPPPPPQPTPAPVAQPPAPIDPSASVAVLVPPPLPGPVADVVQLTRGGLDEGEDHVTALRRELIEEVGLHDVEIGPHIWTREHRIVFINGQWDGQREHIHLVRVPHVFEPQPSLDWDTLNAEYLFELRWWHIDEIAEAQEMAAERGIVFDVNFDTALANNPEALGATEQDTNTKGAKVINLRNVMGRAMEDALLLMEGEK